MRAICVTTGRELEVRNVPEPQDPPPRHLLVRIEAAAINHGDKAFLASRPPINRTPTANDVWGASAVGRVIAVGEGVAPIYLGKPVAIYLSMRRTPETIGLWCEVAQVHHLNCLILPDDVQSGDYCGSLVNAITAYAFLKQAQEAGHKGIVATAGQSATGRALAALARDTGLPVIHLVRSTTAREALRQKDVEHILVTTDQNFEQDFATLAERLGATAVFDGLGGDIVSRLAPRVPRNSTFYFYGFLAAGVPFSLETRVFMERNLTMKLFSNFLSPTVTDSERLAAALDDLQGWIADPLFRTPIGKMFAYDKIDAAMSYSDDIGGRPVLQPV